MKKKKKGADPAAIYTRSGADRGKTPQFCSVRFCKLIFRRATIFCRARGGLSEKERRGEERRRKERFSRAVSLSLSLTLMRRTPRFLDRERATKWQLSLLLRSCPVFSFWLAVSLFALSSRLSVTDDFSLSR